MIPHQARAIAAVLDDDADSLQRLLDENPGIARAQFSADRLFEERIFHWIYSGDTLLHLVAAGHRSNLVSMLARAGADANANGNRRHATPLHYASDGFVTGKDWNESAQLAAIDALLTAGARLDLHDSNGATALHRAVRTRCAAAVDRLLAAGADALARNESGSTPFHLAVQVTGRGGSGDPVAREAQRRIIDSFTRRGISTALRDGKGVTVREHASRSWAIECLRPDGAQ